MTSDEPRPSRGRPILEFLLPEPVEGGDPVGRMAGESAIYEAFHARRQVGLRASNVASGVMRVLRLLALAGTAGYVGLRLGIVPGILVGVFLWCGWCAIGRRRWLVPRAPGRIAPSLKEFLRKPPATATQVWQDFALIPATGHDLAAALYREAREHDRGVIRFAQVGTLAIGIAAMAAVDRIGSVDGVAFLLATAFVARFYVGRMCETAFMSLAVVEVERAIGHLEDRVRDRKLEFALLGGRLLPAPCGPAPRDIEGKVGCVLQLLLWCGIPAAILCAAALASDGSVAAIGRVVVAKWYWMVGASLAFLVAHAARPAVVEVAQRESVERFHRAACRAGRALPLYLASVVFEDSDAEAFALRLDQGMGMQERREAMAEQDIDGMNEGAGT